MAGAQDAAGAHEVPQAEGALQGAAPQDDEQADAAHGDEPHDDEQLLEQRPANADWAEMANTAIAKNRFFRIRCILQIRCSLKVRCKRVLLM